MKILALLLGLVVLTSSATASTRCRTSKSASTTYTVCESPSGKSECRSSRSGSVVYTSCR
jgi:hypothetical protein